MNEKQFLSLMSKAGFSKPEDEKGFVDFERLSAVVSIGLLEMARLAHKMGDTSAEVIYSHRARRLLDKLDELGIFDSINN